MLAGAFRHFSPPKNPMPTVVLSGSSRLQVMLMNNSCDLYALAPRQAAGFETSVQAADGHICRICYCPYCAVVVVKVLLEVLVREKKKNIRKGTQLPSVSPFPGVCVCFFFLVSVLWALLRFGDDDAP